MVLCPSEEYHEIGAIIVNNFFLLAGFNSQYIGANTPKQDIIMAVKALQPDYVALSVTNYYNIVITKQITEAIKSQYPAVKIIVGGQAFRQAGAIEQVTHDIYLKNVQEIDAIFNKASR
jgi:methanogenic corrinoid protein MtbC1